MDTTGQVTKWVENKFGKMITKHLQENIVDESSTFDVEIYVNYLLQKYFSEDDVKNVKHILISEPYRDLFVFSENSTGGRSAHDSAESESNELHIFSLSDIIKNLESESYEITKKSLKVLEACVEDLINQPSWNKVKEIFEKLLNKTTGDRELVNLILKVLQKPLMCLKKPQIVCEGFRTIAEVTTNQIDMFNLEYNNKIFEEIYDIKEKEWLSEKRSPNLAFPSYRKSVISEMLIKLMWLLMDCQHQISVKWIRFNEARFREIIFSFIHLLSSTNAPGDSKLSGLELLSVLSPKASWCRYWCHTAVGRSLLCSAFRKYKHFFISIIEIILDHIKIKKDNKLPPVGVGVNSVSPKLTDGISWEFKFDLVGGQKYSRQKKNVSGNRRHENAEKINKNSRVKETKSISEWIIHNIPKHVVTEAVFLHSISLVSCLIQFRSGRTLFPIQTTTRKRLLSAQDLSVSIIDFLESRDHSEWGVKKCTYTSVYETEVLKILEILKRVEAHINSSRMSAERPQLSYA